MTQQLQQLLQLLNQSHALLDQALPGFLTKFEEIGVKNCQNVYCKTIPAV
ncbi:hypothetical protein NIES4072_03870 [Nostoc commune NIES-4072]|uniref:Uncharacterized protein n=1 Tax=Nostoc commune NIES-4072 TaxID=2005467 RepID=A0A2R5FLS2_NOSCO|nr:hypothetical protein [Nostoc commune]BBD65934.1 hypothetical protein NIES4070_22950 [Nostoc commune HK-02]GBG16741.1 hypothetical protein NIES4072_03870 [Nostoc commune NIES-4072]